MTDDQTTRHKRIYGRGLYDGLRKAGITNPEQFMNSARLAEIERGLTGVARKVLDAVPIMDMWESYQIQQDLIRRGHHIDRRTVDGCINSLKDSGLVREPARGKFSRVTARAKLEPVPAANDSALIKTQPAKVETASSADPMERLAGLAAKVRKLSDDAVKLAEEIDDAAVEFVEQMQKIAKDGERLRELRELLKGV